MEGAWTLGPPILHSLFYLHWLWVALLASLSDLT